MSKLFKKEITSLILVWLCVVLCIISFINGNRLSIAYIINPLVIVCAIIVTIIAIAEMRKGGWIIKQFGVANIADKTPGLINVCVWMNFNKIYTK